MRHIYGVGMFLLLCWGLPLHAQVLMQGKVVDAVSGEVLVGVHVRMEGMLTGAITDYRGAFELELEKAGQQTLLISGIGYQELRELVDIQPTANEGLVFALAPDIALLPSVEILATSLTGGLGGRYDLPGLGHYVPAAVLRKFSHTDIHKILQNVPGVYFQEEDGFGLRPNIGLRGTSTERSSKISIMEDGILAAPAPYAASAAYYFPTAGRMHGVEVLKGSSQIKFGPFTTGGAINLLSTPIPDGFAGRLNLSTGSFNNQNLHSWVGYSNDHVGLLAETFQYNADGFKTLPTGDPTGFDKQDYLLKFRLNTGPNAKVYQALTVKHGWASETSNETYLGLAYADYQQDPYQRYTASQKDLMETEHSQLSLKYTIQPVSNLQVNLTAYENVFSRNWYKLDKVRAVAGGPLYAIADVLDNPDNFQAAYEILKSGVADFEDPLWLKANNRVYTSRGLQLLTEWKHNGEKADHHLLFGLRRHYDEEDRFQYNDTYTYTSGEMALTHAGAPGSESNRVESANAFAGFLQYTLKFERFRLVPGLRYEEITISRADYGKADPERSGAQLKTRSNEVAVFIPGLGFHVDVTDKLNLFGGVHKGFSPPGSSPGSEAEESINYELGTLIETGAWKSNIAFFLNDFSNLLGSDLAATGGLGDGDLYNAGEVRSRGIEANIQYLGIRGTNGRWQLPLQLNYNYFRSTFANSFDSDFEAWGQVTAGDELPYVPTQQASFSINFNHDRLDVFVQSQWISAMRTTAGSGAIAENSGIPEQFTLDAGVHVHLNSRLSLYATVLNLNNADFWVASRPAGLRPIAPRRLRVGLTANF
ncbi:MAG: TonB-dependent receptor [Saprospiraceae bacterium]|nr:TonB-dependent receptor [Saprospiraceae bacterium]